MSNIVRRTIAFNIDDPDQLMMLQHADKRQNFSAYGKRLIQRDMEGGTIFREIVEVIDNNDKKYMDNLI